MAAPSEKASFSLDLGIDDISSANVVQPFGEGAALQASTNTRLHQRGVVNKAPGASQVTTLDDGASCGGIVPAGHVDSSVAFFRAHAGGNIRIAGGDSAELNGALSANPANTYWPAQVTRAGAVPGAPAHQDPAVCHYDGHTYFAIVRDNENVAGEKALYLCVIDDEDRLVAVPTKVATVGSTVQWAGLTSHLTNGVRLWWTDGTDVFGAEVTLSGLAVTVGSPSTIYTPVSVADYNLHVTSNGDDTYAYLCSVTAGSAADLAVNKIDVTDFSKSTTTKASFVGNANSAIVATHIVIGGTGYLCVAAGNFVSGQTEVAMYTTSSMTNTWSSSVVQHGHAAAIQYYAANGSSYVIVAASDPEGNLSTQLVGSTEFRFFTLGGVDTVSVTMQWLRVIGNGASHQISATEIYPYFPMQHQWDYSPALSAREFLFDPSIEVYTVNGTSKLTPIARLGYNTAVRYDIKGQKPNAYFASSCAMVESRLLVTYLQDNFRDAYNQDGYVARYAFLDLDFEATGEVGPPRYANTPEGGAIIAAALPAHWDGAEVTEFSPLHQPRVYVDTTGGTGVSLDAGTYQFRVIVSWKDSTGEIVRSLPSPAMTITQSGAQSPKLWAYAPTSMKNGIRQERLSVQVYATLADGNVFYAQDYVASSIGNDYWVFDYIDQPTSGYLNPLIYSTGSATSPLANECPGAIWDVACVGHRLWMINAENRSEALYTKPKESGIRFEWNYVNTIPFPASAGKLMAVADANGTPLFLTSTGLYQVAGEGPDANNQGQQFSKPFLVGTTNCTDRNSVVTTPVGVMWRSGNRFALFSGGSVRLFDVGGAAVSRCFGVAHFRDYQEVAWYGDYETYVYNYGRDRWTLWDSSALLDSQPIVAATQVPVSQCVLMASNSGSTISLQNPDSTSTTAQIGMATGWVTLGGPQDDVILRDLIIYAERGGAHGLSVEIQLDYGAVASVTKTYSAAEITAGAQDGRYTLPMQFPVHQSRSFRLVISETDAVGSGFKPVSVTVVFGRNPDVARKSFVHSLRK